MGFAEGRAEGGSIKDLHEKGFVKPFGKIDRRIRWQLERGKFEEGDFTSMEELLFPQYKNYKIDPLSDGFQLERFEYIASYTVSADGFAALCIFKVDLLKKLAEQLDLNFLQNEAISVIKNCLKGNKIKNLGRYTFEFYINNFEEEED